VATDCRGATAEGRGRARCMQAQALRTSSDFVSGRIPCAGRNFLPESGLSPWGYGRAAWDHRPRHEPPNPPDEDDLAPLTLGWFFRRSPRSPAGPWQGGDPKDPNAGGRRVGATWCQQPTRPPPSSSSSQRRGRVRRRTPRPLRDSGPRCRRSTAPVVIRTGRVDGNSGGSLQPRPFHSRASRATSRLPWPGSARPAARACNRKECWSALTSASSLR